VQLIALKNKEIVSTLFGVWRESVQSTENKQRSDTLLWIVMSAAAFTTLTIPAKLTLSSVEGMKQEEPRP
jgi:hypothetical protein